MEPVLASSGLTLQHVCEEGLFLMMDRELFKSLLYNFIDNGRKASPEGSRIQMLAHRQGGQAEIMIRDYGQGIPEKELEKVRQPFYMVDKSRSRKAGGAGLGLSLIHISGRRGDLAGRHDRHGGLPAGQAQKPADASVRESAISRCAGIKKKGTAEAVPFFCRYRTGCAVTVF